MDELELLSEIEQIWQTSSVLHNQAEARWAKNKRLVQSRHVTKRKAGQSNLFIPKIESFHNRKQADYIASLGSENPVSLKPTLNSTKEGSMIMETLCNHYMSNAGINWKSAVVNDSHNALTYNFAPFIMDWDRVADESTLDTGEVVENLVYSHATLEILPPEDMRIDPSIGWDEVGQARFAVIRRWRDRAYATRMHADGVWPEIDEGYFKTGDTFSTNTLLQAERSPFGNTTVDDSNVDNGLLEIWETYSWREDGDGEFKPMRMVSLRHDLLLEEPEILEIDISNQDGSDPWPFGIGRIYAEPHEVISRAMPERLEHLQIEANAIRNQRRDNVALVLNREKFMTADAGVDPATLSRSYSGKVTVVRNRNSVWWDTPPDVTGSSYKEEQSTVSDMERLVAESDVRFGGVARGANTATESKLGASNSDMAVGLDAAMFRMTFAEPVVRKLIRMIKQAAPIEIFERAAEEAGIQVEDAYIEAIKGAYKVTVGAGAQQIAKDVSISQASNMAAVLQSVYGPQANYYPIMAPMLESNGLDPETILQNPQQQTPNTQVQDDAGGVTGEDNMSVQPNVQFSGGAMSGNAGSSI